MSKTISFSLSESSIEKARQQLIQYRDNVNKKVELLVKSLVDRGVKVTQTSISTMGAVYTGELLGSIQGAFNPSTGVGMIYTDCQWAKFVLFGTGIKAKNSPSKYANIVGWKYDVNNHGENGWWYFKDGEWHWSNGFPSRDFFDGTIKMLHSELGAEARKVFK
jgi:hypothetical protein